MLKYLKVCIGIAKTKFVKLFIADLFKDTSDFEPKMQQNIWVQQKHSAPIW